jgi:hypothetical protein
MVLVPKHLHPRKFQLGLLAENEVLRIIHHEPNNREKDDKKEQYPRSDGGNLPNIGQAKPHSGSDQKRFDNQQSQRAKAERRVHGVKDFPAHRQERSELVCLGHRGHHLVNRKSPIYGRIVRLELESQSNSERCSRLLAEIVKPNRHKIVSSDFPTRGQVVKLEKIRRVRVQKQTTGIGVPFSDFARISKSPEMKKSQCASFLQKQCNPVTNHYVRVGASRP